MWLPRGRREKCTWFWWESSKRRDHLEDQGVDGIRMDLREIGLWGIEWMQLVSVGADGCLM
jgi:alpha-glucosidase (family GH31 glycosyl hydrolase)